MVPPRTDVPELNHPINPPPTYYSNFGQSLKYDKFEGNDIHLIVKRIYIQSNSRRKCKSHLVLCEDDGSHDKQNRVNLRNNRGYDSLHTVDAQFPMG